MDGRESAPEGAVYTQEQVDELLAMAAQDAAQAQEQAVSAAVAQARQAACAEAERAAAEASAQQEAAREREAREAAMSVREAAIMRREQRAAVMEALASEGLPAELAEVVDYADAETMEASLARIRTAWSAAVQRGIAQRMSGSAPRTGGGQVRPGTLREAIEHRYAGA